MTPRSWESREKPQECHPPPSPEGAASPWRRALHRMPAAGAAPARRVLLPFARAQPGWGGARSFRPRAPLGGSPRKKDERYPLQTFARSLHRKPPAARHLWGAQPARVPGDAPAALPFGLLLSSREFLQSHIATAGPPQRESGGAALAPEGARAPARYSLTGSSSARRHRAVRPSRPDRSPVTSGLHTQPHREPRNLHLSCLTATEGQRPPRTRVILPTPANHLQPHLHTRSHWAMQISIGDNLTPAPGTGLRSGRGRSCAEAGPGCGGGAGMRRAGPGADSYPFGRVCGTGVLCLGGEWGGVVVFSLGWSRLPSVFLVGAHFFFIVVSCLLFLGVAN